MDALDHLVANSSKSLRSAAGNQRRLAEEEDPLEDLPTLLDTASGMQGEYELPRQKWHLQGTALKSLYESSQEPELARRMVEGNVFQRMIPNILVTCHRRDAMKEELAAKEKGEGFSQLNKMYRHDEAQRMMRQQIADLRHFDGEVQTWQLYAGFILKNLAGVKELRHLMCTPSILQQLFTVLDEHKDVRLSIVLALTEFADCPEEKRQDMLDAGLVEALNRTVYDDDYLVRRNTEIGDFHDDVCLALAALYAKMATPRTASHMEKMGAAKALNFMMRKAQEAKGYNARIMIAVMKTQSRILPPLPKPKPARALEVAEGLTLTQDQSHLGVVKEWD